ncbi:MAG: hypothetical protein J0L84_02995 [Verrucomicrobia bacterium]|nr:hypothetical protein [Verrucomicrobiota bacterium]
MKKTLLILAGVAGVLIGLGLILPAVALWRSGSSDTAWIAGPLLVGTLLAAGSLLLPWAAWKRL